MVPGILSLTLSALLTLGLLTGFVLHWSAPVVFFFLRCDNIVKSIAGLIRLRSGKWIRVVTREAA